MTFIRGNGAITMFSKSIKYLVCPGYVVSKYDSDIHYINAEQLMKLYRVDPKECEIYEPVEDRPHSQYEADRRRHRDMIKLEPRYDGNYNLELK